jgi:hypothetical protein
LLRPRNHLLSGPTIIVGVVVVVCAAAIDAVARKARIQKLAANFK